MAKNITSIASTLTLTSVLTLCLTMPLIGCVATTEPRYIIDSETYQAQGKSERIKFIILHYTVSDNERSIKLLATGNVSSHYLILSNDDDKIYNLVPESERAWHAGDGGFAGRTILNDTSIGIEIVNDGIKKQYRNALKKEPFKKGSLKTEAQDYHPYEHYVEFEEIQIQKVAQLVQDLALRYKISPKDIIGHSDMAPSRKIDPGAKFPWQRLHTQYGIGAWYDEQDKQLFMNQDEFEGATISEIKQEFREYGYRIDDSNAWDKKSHDVIYAFQLHFSPQHLTATMDLETYAILRALNKKYAGSDNFY